MNYRNATRLPGGQFDCEIEHPVFGWIPFTADPSDTGAEFDVAGLCARIHADPLTTDAEAPTQPDPRASMSLTFAQLLIGLVAEEWITQAEGTAWLAGTPPAAVMAVISQLPADQQFPALARATRPSTVLRLDPLVTEMGQAAGKTPEEIDTFFLNYHKV